jgi:hypothetical protein
MKNGKVDSSRCTISIIIAGTFIVQIQAEKNRFYPQSIFNHFRKS